MKRFWIVMIIALVSLAALPTSALADAPLFERFNSAPTVEVVHELGNQTSVSITFEPGTGPLRSFQKEGPWEPTASKPDSGEPPAYGGGGEGGWPGF